MKVILTQDVKSLGKKGEIVEVNQGYARNFVLPKKLGVEATPENLNNLKLKNQNDEKIIFCPTAEDILPIMDRIITADKIITELKGE